MEPQLLLKNVLDAINKGDVSLIFDWCYHPIAGTVEDLRSVLSENVLKCEVYSLNIANNMLKIFVKAVDIKNDKEPFIFDN